MATDTNALPANLRYAESAGADVMFVFGEPPAEALAPGKSKMPTKGAWLAFVGQIARERIRYAELWNEPAEGYWDGTPEELAEYCRLAYPILSASGKTVLSPSLTSWDADPGYSFADRFLSAGGGEWCDEIAFHCYSRSPAALADGVASLRALLKRHRVSRPIRNTEYNIVPSDPTLRSAYIAQSLLIQASLGVVGAVWDPEPTVAANDYTDDTVRRVAQILLGASVGPITSANGVSRCLVSRDSHDTELSWTGNSFPATALRMAA
jgi:hypothetical protein